MSNESENGDRNSLTDGASDSAAAFDALLAEPTRQIGPYRLFQEIGVGGMGTVWMAEQEKPVRRRVAVKLIKAGRADKQIIARFEAERQALSMMDHPNIARVLDAGTAEGGTPYFVMELVQGEPVTKYCDRHRLTPQQRLELFIPICHAIQHAHQKGIIHRDLKPSNILVHVEKGEPVAKVIDFGLAKALQHQTKLTDKTIFTEFGQIVGTVQYMSPEQARTDAIDVDTRSDIYSLGVILYELMAGSTPLDEETIQSNAVLQLLEIVRVKEPPRPSQRLSSSGEKLSSISEQRQVPPTKLQQLLRGDLDWVVMKALEKDRTRRYATPNDFADDIRRYLDGDAVEARPPTTGYRVRKFVRKNRALVATVGAFVAVLAAGIMGSTMFALQAQRSRKEAEVAQVTAEVAAKRSEDVLEIVTNSFQSVDPTSGSDATMSAKDVLLEAKNNLAESDLDDEGRVVLLSRLSRCFSAIGELSEAIATAEESLRLRKKSDGGDSDESIEASNQLAHTYRLAGRLKEALPLYQRVFEERKSRLGVDNPSTLSSMSNLAAVLRMSGQLDEGLILLEESLRRRKATLGMDHPSTLNSLNSLALAYDSMGRLEDALPLYEQAYHGGARVHGKSDPRTLAYMGNVAGSYQYTGRADKALPLKEEQFRLATNKLGADHPDTLHCMNDLADLYTSLGRLQEALALYEETLRLRKIKIGANHPYTMFTMNGMAHTLLFLNRIDEAIELYEETLRLRQNELGEEHTATLFTMGELGRALVIANRLDEAERLAERVLDVLSSLPNQELRTQSALVDLAHVYELQKRPEAAKELLDRRVTLQDGQPTLYTDFDAMSTYGGVLLQLGQTEKAADVLHESCGELKGRASTEEVTFHRERYSRALRRMMQLAEAQNDTEARAKWHEELEALNP